MRRLMPVLTAVLIGGAVLTGPAAAKIKVFTVAGQPVTHAPEGAVVVEIDRPARLDQQLSEGLPHDRAAAARLVAQRLSRFKKAYGQAYDGLLRAWRLGVKRVPAVVVDGQYVVYGQSDVAAAVAEIRRAESKEK